MNKETREKVLEALKASLKQGNKAEPVQSAVVVVKPTVTLADLREMMVSSGTGRALVLGLVTLN